MARQKWLGPCRPSDGALSSSACTKGQVGRLRWRVWGHYILLTGIEAAKTPTDVPRPRDSTGSVRMDLEP